MKLTKLMLFILLWLSRIKCDSSGDRQSNSNTDQSSNLDSDSQSSAKSDSPTLHHFMKRVIVGNRKVKEDGIVTIKKVCFIFKRNFLIFCK